MFCRCLLCVACGCLLFVFIVLCLLLMFVVWLCCRWCLSFGCCCCCLLFVVLGDVCCVPLLVLGVVCGLLVVVFARGLSLFVIGGVCCSLLVNACCRYSCVACSLFAVRCWLSLSFVVGYCLFCVVCCCLVVVCSLL